MRINTYIVEHDWGFAPNPFHGVCSLAACKPRIRKHASRGDYIAGTGSKSSGMSGKLIYWMRVDDIISFDDYWGNPKYRLKKPCIHGSMMRRYGDNIYHRDAMTGEFIQEHSFHSGESGALSEIDRQRDTGYTENVLIGSEFAYWGGSGPLVPDEFSDMIAKTQGHKCRFPVDRRDALIAWLLSMPERGFIHMPGLWKAGKI